MNLLLDTCTFLWILRGERPKIGDRALSVYQNRENRVYFSAVCSWEIAIKNSIDKLSLKGDPKQRIPEEIRKLGLDSLPILPEHTLEISSLPRYHSDPFDRLLIAQAKSLTCPILTPDKKFRKYQVELIWE